MRARLRSDYYAQVDNGDPFAPLAWRAPVYRTPESAILAVQHVRTLWRLARFIVRHPLLDLAIAVPAVTWAKLGWPGLVTLSGLVVAFLTGLRIWRPAWFTRWVAVSARSRWRWARYRWRWQGILSVAGLTEDYQGRMLVPILGKVRAGRCADRLTVRLVSGQAPQAFADRSVNLPHGLGALSCRVRTGPPGSIILELVRRDALATIIPSMPIHERTDLRALPVGRREDGMVLTIRLHGTHVLVAGATGSGKGSWLWCLVRPCSRPSLTASSGCTPVIRS